MGQSLRHIQFPGYQLPASGWRRWLRQALAAVASTLTPQRAARVRSGDLPARLNWWDRLLVAGWISDCEARQALEELGPLHAWLWRSEQAVEIHRLCDERFVTHWQPLLSKVVAPLQQQLALHPGRITRLCEIGCGTGRVLADLRQRLGPSALQYIGLDLSPDQIAANRRNPACEGLQFECADARHWVPQQLGAGSVVLTSGGVFEYFSAAELTRMFRWLAGTGAPGMLVLAEPIPDDMDLDQETQSRAWHSERTLGHNYRHLVAKSGLRQVFEHTGEADGMRWLLLVAVSPELGAEPA